MGQGDIGQLGLGEDMVERKKPHPVGGALEHCRVTQVVCGGMHSVAVTDDGKVRKLPSLFFLLHTHTHTHTPNSHIIHVHVRDNKQGNTIQHNTMALEKN